MTSQAKLNKTAAGSSKMRIPVDTVIYRQRVVLNSSSEHTIVTQIHQTGGMLVFSPPICPPWLFVLHYISHRFLHKPNYPLQFDLHDSTAIIQFQC